MNSIGTENKGRSDVLRSLWWGTLAWLFSLVLYSPRLTLFLAEGAGDTRRDDLLLQCADPLSRQLWEPLLAYRVVQPLLANVLGWCGGRRDIQALLGSPGIAYVAMALTLVCIHWAISRRFSQSTTLLVTFAIATTHVTQWTNTLWGHPDSLTLLPIAILLCNRHSLVVFGATLIGATNDERFVLALPFLALWWWSDDVSVAHFLRQSSRDAIAVLFGLSATLLLRFALTQGWIGPGIIDPYRGGGSLFTFFLSRLFMPAEWPGLLLMILLGFRWLWFLPLLAWWSLTARERSIRDGVFLLALPLVVISTVTSADISRNCAFLFPAILVSMELLLRQRHWSVQRLNRWTAWALGLNVLTPAAMVFGLPVNWWATSPLEWKDWATLYLPLPLNLWQWFRVPAGASSW